MAFSVVVGFSLMDYNVNQLSIRQAVTPDRMLGRVQSGVFAIAVGVIITLTSALPSIFSPLRTLRGVPRSQVEAPC